MADFVAQSQKNRNDPLGPVTLNQLHANIEQLDVLARREHFLTGKHNAVEIPWVLGHIDTGTTGYLFDTTYGGGTIARPSAGQTTVSIASGVVGSVYSVGSSLVSQGSILVNVSDSDIANRPYLATAEFASATSLRTRTRRFTGTLGTPGNSWDNGGGADAAQDVAVHAMKQPVPASTLLGRLEKQRRDFLTEQATDWDALVKNQAATSKLLGVEHTSSGVHNANRIAKGTALVRWDGSAYSLMASHGVSSVSRTSAGIIVITISSTMSSTNLAACFPTGQPAADDDLVIINGRATSTTQFTFYTYGFSVSENKWS
ncbi:MAG: hypothetical protein JNM17_04150, partial [Archangium sp.]|nr:hypothetical protein [Archangium sp.]